MMIAGFSCKDLSNLKRGHAAEAHDGCLGETSSSTGTTRATFEGRHWDARLYVDPLT